MTAETTKEKIVEDVLSQETYRLWEVDFDTAMNFEEGMYIYQSQTKPTEDEVVTALYRNMYSGAIYYNDCFELYEKDMREYSGHITLMRKER